MGKGGKAELDPLESKLPRENPPNIFVTAVL